MGVVLFMSKGDALVICEVLPGTVVIFRGIGQDTVEVKNDSLWVGIEILLLCFSMRNANL